MTWQNALLLSVLCEYFKTFNYIVKFSAFFEAFNIVYSLLGTNVSFYFIYELIISFVNIASHQNRLYEISFNL